MMYDCCTRTRLTLVVSIALSIIGGILLEGSRPAYAQSRPNIQGLPIISITRDGPLYLNEKPVSINVLVDELKRDFPTASDVYVQQECGLGPNFAGPDRIECGEASNSGKVRTTRKSKVATKQSSLSGRPPE